MKTTWPTIAILLLLTIANANKESARNQQILFPQLLWTFWDGALDDRNSNIFIKLCFDNMEHQATKSGWKFNLVTYKNLHQHLSKSSYEKCMMLMSHVNQNFKQMRADIIRLFLLKEHGGMWVDASTFFVQNMGWINNIKKSNLPVINKISSETDFISFRLQGYDKPNSIVWDQELKKHVVVSPGIQNWAMIAKKNVTFVQDSLRVIQEIIIQGQKSVEEKAFRNGIVLSDVANNTYFKFGIYSFQLVLQYKQKELDQHNALLRASNKTLLPKYAIQYYKIWTLNSFTMGFNLQTLTDGIAPFLAVLFLYSNVKKIDQLSIKLNGFVKLGGVKRKYIEVMLQNMVNPSMCFVTFEDAYKVSNQSFIYKYMIEDNNEQTGLILKDHINNIQQYKIKRSKNCEVIQQKKMDLFEEKIQKVLLYIYFLIIFMFVACGIWIKRNMLLSLQSKKLLYGIIPALIVITYVFFPQAFPFSNKDTGISQYSCANIQLQFQSKQLKQSQIYLQQLRDQLPKDNGKMFQMFFQEFIHELKGDLSSFISKNQLQYLFYFGKYSVGIFLCFLLIFLNSFSVFDKLTQYVNCRNSFKKALLVLTLCLLFAIFLLSTLTIKKAVFLQQSTEKSICYIIQMPNYLSNTSNLVKVSESNNVNYIQFFQIFNNAFKKIFMLAIGFRVTFQQRSNWYLNQLYNIRTVLSSTPQSENLLKVIQSKQKLVKSIQSQVITISNTLVCQNRLIYLIDFVTKNMKDLNKKIIFFLSHHIDLSNFSFMFSALPFAISIIFCFFSGILLIKNIRNWKHHRLQTSFKKYRPTIVLMIILSFVISFILQGVVVINYYFCDFLSNYKTSLKQSNQFIMSLVPDKCMAQNIGDLFQKNLRQNFRLRQKPYEDYLNLSESMTKVMNFPYNNQKQLLSKISIDNNNKFDTFNNLSNEYNLFVQKYAQEYFVSKTQIQKIFQTNYNIRDMDLLQHLQKIIQQPFCVFNFNILYEMASIFRFIGYFYLTAFAITYLIQFRNVLIIDKIPSFEIADSVTMNEACFQEIGLKQMDQLNKTEIIQETSSKVIRFDNRSSL